MNYVCSDIHGNLEVYLKVINSLSQNDRLYIIGDVIDRKPNGLDIIKDIIHRDNVELLLGNHELMMLSSVLTGFERCLVDTWIDERNGGVVTMQALLGLSDEKATETINYLTSCKIATKLSLDNKVINLVHGYYFSDLDECFDLPFKEIVSNICAGDVSPDSVVFDALWKSPLKKDKINDYKSDEFYIHGHVPSYKIKPFVYNNITVIDGGLPYNGNLILYCLDDDSFRLYS